MAERALINLITGMEDTERVMIAFLVATAAQKSGKRVAMFLTKEAVRLAVPGHAQGVPCDGCPQISDLVEEFADGGGELLVCPICAKSRAVAEGDLAANARLGGATPMWEWIDEGSTAVFSY